MTDEVYDYMLDEIIGELNRARSRMNDIVKHLESHSTPARLTTSTAKTVTEQISQALVTIDTLPVLGDSK